MIQAIESHSFQAFSQSFDDLNIGVLFITPERDIIYANKEVCQIFGYSQEEILKISSLELAHNEDETVGQQIKQAIEKGELKVTVIKDYKNKSGGVLKLELHVNLKLDFGFFIIFVKDITPQIKNTERMNRLAKTLEFENTSKNQLLSLISHDLRGPIGTSLGFINELIENDDEFGKKERLFLLERIYNSSKRSLELLEELLIWTSTITGVVKLKEEKVSLQTLLIEQLKGFENRIKLKNITIENHIVDDCNALADKFSIAAVIRNLISNSIKFTNEGGKISFNCKCLDKKMLEFTITDTGIGMDEETLKKIFDSSGRYTRPGTNKEKGSGIGLKLCKDFIELNGGEIFAKSEKGKGSIMGFVINKHIAIL